MIYLTPEQAQQKFCPYRYGQLVATCLGDRCMGWRPQLVHANTFNTVKEPTGKGYCGFAGKISS